MRLDLGTFVPIFTNIIGLEPLPCINSIYQRVVREERRIGAFRTESKKDIVGFVGKSEGGVDTPTMSGLLVAVARSWSTMTCTDRGKNGHYRKEYWQLIGYPDWYTERGSGDRGRRRGAGRGRGCGISYQIRSNDVQAKFNCNGICNECRTMGDSKRLY